MTPSDLLTYTRQRYNAIGDTFFPDGEIYNMFWKAQLELAVEFNCIERVYETPAVANQRAYDKPTNTIKIYRLTYDGMKLFPNDFLSDDAITGQDEDESVTGVPQWYQQWGESFYLRAVPGTSEEGKTLRLYTYDIPSVPTANGTLDVPAVYHPFLADYALWVMCMQDKNFAAADKLSIAWKENKRVVDQLERQKNSSDMFITVRDINTIGRDARFPR